MASWRFIFRFYIIAIFIFTAFRLLLFLLHTDLADGENWSTIFQAFSIGWRFDTVVSCYILIGPFAALSILNFFAGSKFGSYQPAYYLLLFLFVLAFMVSSIDIPWFNHFYSRLNIGAFQWMDHPAFMASMIFSEPRYWLALIPFTLFSFLFIVLSRVFILKRTKADPQKLNGKWKEGLIFVIGLTFLILGIRGRLEPKSPIRSGTAYFSNNAFLNQLGLNPGFTLISGFLDSFDEKNQKIQLFDSDEAVKIVQSHLNISEANQAYPLLRVVRPEGNPRLYNVVLVLMESMNAEKMSSFGNPSNLTPFLDSIAKRGLFFRNIYTAGIHTYNGIFSTLFSYPAIFLQHPMKVSIPQQFNGIGSELKKWNYSTVYFTTHDGQFDNAEGFLKANGFDRVYSESDYPSDEIQGTLGVPDDYLFEFGVKAIDDLAASGKPFLSVFLTSSDHGPYFLPEYYKPRNPNLPEQMVEYADWSLKKLLDLCAEKEWFDSTLFVFVADHGSWVSAVHDMPLSFHHTPLIIYNPDIVGPETSEAIGGQIDVFPTIMSLLNVTYINNSFGIDLLSESRPYIYFCADSKYGILSDSLYLIKHKGEAISWLYRHRHFETTDVSNQYPEEVRKMETYMNVHMQAAQIIRDRNLTYYPH